MKSNNLANRRGGMLLRLSLCLAGVAFAPAAFPQAAPPGPTNCWLFSSSDILNPAALAQELSARSGPVSAFVWSQLPATAQQTLTDPATLAPNKVSTLVAGLNALVQGNSIYDPRRFAGVALSPATRILLAQPAQPGANAARLNRLLLEDAYPRELRKSPPPPRPLPAGTGVRTAQSDYPPGATAQIHGWGFQAGETVINQVLHADGTPSSGAEHQPWAVSAGADGTFQTTWHVCEDDCLGSVLKLTATGQASGRTAQALFADAPGAPTYQQLKSFGKPSPGGNPLAGLIQGTDGALYGTASQGGSGGAGTVFKLNPDGTGFTALKNFDSATTGGYPICKLLQGMDGALYGTANVGGSSNYGTVFRLNTNGTGFTVLTNFDNATMGGNPQAGLIQGTDGALYGTASSGGSGGYGTVFRLNLDGTGFTVFTSFDNITAGGYPQAALIEGTDGALYGTTSSGGSTGYGTVFRLATNGTSFAVLTNFDYTTMGGFPAAGLMQGADGVLYGTTFYGGSNYAGTAFRLNPDGSGFNVLQSFDYTAGGYPSARMLQGADGALYGTAYLGGSGGYGTVFRMETNGTGFMILTNFDDYTTGGLLAAELIQGMDGRLYGTARTGGGGDGTVFRLNLDGTGFAVLRILSNGPDLSEGGGYPDGKLVQGAGGALYGTTVQGGSGSGTVFKLNPDGTGFSVLTNFDSFTTGFGVSGLLLGTDGALYGAAPYGGSSYSGTVFKLNTDGSGLTILTNFDYFATGAYPNSELLQGADGALYGTTRNGGSSYSGTVFKLNPDGSGFTVLTNFDYSTTGSNPNGGLLQGADGTLYGTTGYGGSGGYGTVFRLNPDGTGLTVLTNLDYSTTGSGPNGGLLQGSDGALYGTANSGGSNFSGTIYKLNPDGTGFTVLLSFDSSTTGAYPYAGLLQGAGGVLYGTASQGGSSGSGTVFQLNPDGTGFTVLLNLDSFTTGADPSGGLMRGMDGNLYGTTYLGGDANAGTVFRLVFPTSAPTNTPPVARCHDVTVMADANCTAAVSVDFGSSDPDAGDSITLRQTPAGPYSLGPTLVTLTATDSHGATNSCTALVTVWNPNPVVTLTGPSSGALFAINTPVNFTATFTDANGGTHTGTWMFDSLSQAATIVEPVGATPGQVSATHTFTAAGVYSVKLTVNDNCGGSGTANQIGGLDLLVIVYDPSAGFVSGGGWILSPAGAYKPDPTVTGQASFGFVAKYQKGQTIPTGETEFQLHCASFNFQSTSYQWLVVSGAKAQFKGFGRINGAGAYGFLLTATDGQVSGGGGVDKFRIKIWDQASGVICYDNVTGSPDDIDTANPQAIGGGSIVIHK
jgi:uncharacterized repeat protein (TIGR03803 family)